MNAATEDTKATIENTVASMLAEKLSNPTTAIATNKYLTNGNRLVYLTQCTVTESSIPRVKIQIFDRVPGGVQETDYMLYSDQRFEQSSNPMLFGQTPTAVPDPVAVDEATAQDLVTLLTTLPTSQQNIG